ncbi:fungal hydrophobin-domain-containing protein [Lineolata rhizophorae]|uniref:Fungal hydrophobin-domain-containing protein n=1 Tax=Lineolata rhizophorae TaxID=578093 RepID=A0A6A6NVD2_9PEZI|nr:fungal hydrophobin-domain-containing protein [Lineolata rhizophorae]
MHALTIVSALFVAAVSASPAPILDRRQTNVTDICTGLYGNAQCCATDVLDLADLDCFNPPSRPANVEEFESMCSEEGQQAQCCVLPILEQGVLCQDPVAV